MLWRKVRISDHAHKRFHERVKGKRKNKRQLADLVYNCMFSQSRRGIKEIHNTDDSIIFKIEIASHDCIAVIKQDSSDPLARWVVKTFLKEDD